MAKNASPFSPAANGLIADVIKQIEKEQRVKFTPGKVEKITKALVPTLTKLGPEYLETHKNELTNGLIIFLKEGRTYASRIGSEYSISAKELGNIATNLEKHHQPQANAAKLVKASLVKEQTPPLTPEELQLAKIDLLRKEALAKELAKIKTDFPIQKKTKNIVEDSLRDKVVATEDQYQRKGKKAAGMSAGYVATEKATGETFILKQFYIKDSDCRTEQDVLNREDGVRELVGSIMYQFLLYDNAPKEQLVKSSEVPPKSLYVRSKFFKETEQLSVFAGGSPGGLFDPSSPECAKLKNIKGFEKVIASCHMLGELDYHAGNMMVHKDGTIGKIDHGKSFTAFYKDFSSMIVSTNDTFKEFGYTSAISNGDLIFDAEKYSASLKQMSSQLSEEQIDAIVDQRIDVLRKAGFDPKGLALQSQFGNDAIQTSQPETFEDLGRLFKANIKENQNNMQEIAKQVEIIAKFSNVSPAFKQGGWVKAFAESVEKDPIKYAIKNNIKIDGLDPKDYALNSILDQYLKADGPKAKELEAKYIAVLKDLSGAKSLGNIDKNIKHLMLEGVIDQYLKTDNPALRKDLETKYIALQKGLSADKSPDNIDNNIKNLKLESLIDQYLKTDTPARKKDLEVKYIALQKLGEKSPPALLSMESNLGQFLNNPKAADIMANHKDFKGKPIIANIDYLKCELPLIAKCKEVHEKTGKAKDYDTLSTKQKVGIAFASVVPVIGNIIAYYAIKSHNKSEKTKLEKEIGQHLDGIQADLTKLSKKPSIIEGLDAGLISQLDKIKDNVSSNKEKPINSLPPSKVGQASSVGRG